MSCRAFARRIEYQLLNVLATRFQVDEARFHFSPTARNRPLQEFFEALIGSKPENEFSIRLSRLGDKQPALFHLVEYVNE